MKSEPTVFISYSHSDREFVLKLYDDLRKAGVNSWIDKFEIKPGDSLIQKIFSEGLAQSDFFLVILSETSIKSKWVKEELDAAITNKIAGITHIIPILKENCEIPIPLRSLLYIDLSKDYEEEVRNLVKTLHGVSDKPPIGKIPEYVSNLKHSVGGLSKEASTLGSLLLTTEKDEEGYEPQLSSHQLKDLLPDFTSQELNDAVDELESYGLIKADKVVGNAPYYFSHIRATYALFLHFKDEGLGYDPEDDIKQVAATVVAKDEVEGEKLREILQLSPGRINRAVDYLEEYGYVRVIRLIGTAPYNFGEVMATRYTRNFVKENSF